MTAALAAGCAWAAAWVMSARRSGRSVSPSVRSPPRLLLVLALVAMLCVVVRLGAAALVLGAGGCLAVLAARKLFTGARQRSTRRRRQLDVIELCDALAAQLRAGLPASRAIERAFADFPDWRALTTVARLDGDVPAGLRRCAEAPGADGLLVVAAGWEVAGQSGAALAVVLDRVAAGLRADDEARAEVVAALGPPRATAKMLAVLPVFGLALGASMGAHPVRFLLQTVPGMWCLALGVGLALAGLSWVERIASAAEV